MLNNRNWNDRANKDLFFTILSVKNIGVISGSEWSTIGNHLRVLGYGFTNEGCRQHFQALRRSMQKSQPPIIRLGDGSDAGGDLTLNPITRRPGPGRPRKVPGTGGNASPTAPLGATNLAAIATIAGKNPKAAAAVSTTGQPVDAHFAGAPVQTQDVGARPLSTGETIETVPIAPTDHAYIAQPQLSQPLHQNLETNSSALRNLASPDVISTVQELPIREEETAADEFSDRNQNEESEEVDVKYHESEDDIDEQPAKRQRLSLAETGQSQGMDEEAILQLAAHNDSAQESDHYTEEF